MNTAVLARISRAMFERRWVTGAAAFLLLAISLLIAWQREQAAIDEQARQVGVQAGILAGSLAGALAFDDAETSGEYLDALRLDERIQAAGVYGADGGLVAGFARQGDRLPDQVRPQAPALKGRQLIVVEPVRQGTLLLGNVYLRTSVEPFAARIWRYVAIGVVLLLAALLIAMLGASNAAASAANRKLQEQISAREDAERALRQAQKMEALGQLTGGVAHDFNNLLMAASSGLELMERAKTDERRDRLVAGVRDALDRGGRLTQQLLAFSRSTPVQTEIIDIAGQIDKLADLLNRSLREDVDVRFDIAGDIWPIKVDASQLDVAILNVAVNARDAMPRGGQICIRARNRPGALEPGDAVEVSVVDQGVGMSPEAAEKAFEPFFTTKDVGRGTGLGLSQVYGFVRASGGKVSLRSELGRGTELVMLLPRSRQEVTPSVRRLQAAATGAFPGLRVLLVEDDPDLNELVGQMLEEIGIEVLRAASADEGLRRFEGAVVDAVLSDMVMPGEMDGLDLARRLRGRNAALPIVLMTGYSAAAGSAAQEGFMVLRKPFRLEALAASLGEACQAMVRG